MENSSDSPPRSPIKTKNMDLVCNTPTPHQDPLKDQNFESSGTEKLGKIPSPPQDPLKDQNFQSSGTEKLGKIGTPDRLKVPKAFNYPERYRSPTDSMMSPVSKGLLFAKNRKGGGLLLPRSMRLHKDSAC